MNRIVLIAVPQPADLTRSLQLRVGVFIQPMLDGPTLADTPMARWSAPALAKGDIHIEIANDKDAATILIEATPTFQVVPDLWERVFPGKMSTVAQDGEIDDRKLKVTAVANSVDRVAAAYSTLAARPVAAGDQIVADAANAIDLGPGEDDEEDEPVDPALIDAPRSPAAEREFHRTLALLREHPVLMRSLGLVFDVVSEPVDLARIPDEGRMRIVVPAAAFPDIELTTPWTAFRKSGTTLYIPGKDDVTDGMLDLGSDRWSLSTLDADVALAASRDGGRTGTLPALRTGGIALIDRQKRQLAEGRRNRRAVAVRREVTDHALTLDELLLGYRLDVRRGDGAFRSLCARLATYRIDDEAIGGLDAIEEGNVKADAAFDYGDGVLRTDELFVRWQGWSLAVGNPLTPPAGTRQAASDLTWTFRVPPGSLPKLRFGDKYHLRARATDITGGGLAIGMAISDRHSIGPVTYRRYEPIASPQVVDSEPLALAPGETTGDIVVRSDRGVDPDAFALANPNYPQQPQRTLLPSLVSLPMAEQHGAFERVRPDEVAAIIADHSSSATTPGDALFPDPAAAGVAARGMSGGQRIALVTSAWAEWPDGAGKSIVLRPTETGTAAAAEWSPTGDVLTVSLAPGRSMTLLISSTMQGGFPDQFAANDHLPDEDSRDAALNGRHPLLTPATAITLTHAVRKPLKDPSGGLKSDRVPGTTTAELLPEPVDLALDAPSTAAVQLFGSWNEVDNTRTVRRNDVAVGRATLSPESGQWQQPIVHEFGDTRHRRVVYRAVGESRHRHFFAESEEDTLFRVEAELAPVDVPSTERPPRPDVVEVIPAFRWTDLPLAEGAVADRRRDGFLRVILRSPWHRSGEGEQLGILVTTDDAAQIDSVDFVTRVSRDVLHATPVPPEWPHGKDLLLRTVAAALPPSDLGLPIAVIPHDVWHDGLAWNCDVAIDGLQETYMPMVRLSVVRYQRHSLPGLSHSPVMLLAPAPLFPTRRLIVTLRDHQVVVRLSGTAPSTIGHRVLLRLEGCPSAMAATAELSSDGDNGLGGFFRQLLPDQSTTVNTDIVIDLPDTTDHLRLIVTELEAIVPTEGDQVPWGHLPQGRIVFSDVVPLPR